MTIRDNEMSTELQNDLILRTIRHEPVGRTPVWMMRQAGRYLPEYREVREKVDFLTLCKTPELAAEVTIQPVDIVGVDGAIIFSDILTIPEAMGLDLEFVKGQGPVFHNPVRNHRNIKELSSEVTENLAYVGDAISETVQQLDGRVPVIGFSGAPWTLSTYMVEGGSTKDFSVIKKLLYSEPEVFRALLDKLEPEIVEYLAMQIRAGADMIQIFDSWAGVLAPTEFEKFSLRPISRVVKELKSRFPGTPVVVFSKGAGVHLNALAETGADALSLDWMTDLHSAREVCGNRVALQGNLDPGVLLTDPDIIRRETKQMLRAYGDGPGHIANLGHGITPDVPVDNARAFVSAVKEHSGKYHKHNDE